MAKDNNSLDKYYSYYLSPIGWLEIITDEHFLLGVQLIDSLPIDPKIENALSRAVVAQLIAYFTQLPIVFDLPLNPNQTRFAMDIYRCLQKTACGETLSYSELATRAGYPKAARAVGNALNKNPFMIVVPCHRVIHHDRSLGGFALDLSIKKQLLDYEAKYRK